MTGASSRIARRRAHDDEPLLDCADDRADVGAEAERRQAITLLEAILDELPSSSAPCSRSSSSTAWAARRSPSCSTSRWGPSHRASASPAMRFAALSRA